MEKPTPDVRIYGGGAYLYMTTEFLKNSTKPKTFVSLYWRNEIPTQPWAAISKMWHSELSFPPWRVEVNVNPYAPTSEKYALLREGIKTYGHSIVNLKVVNV